MNGDGEEGLVPEIGIVVPKRIEKRENGICDCIDVLVDELRKTGLIVTTVLGVSDEFLKLAAPLDTLGRVAVELQMRKPTHIGMDLQFEWEQADAFVRQPDGSLFSWCERFRCYQHLIYAIVNKKKSVTLLKSDEKEFLWEVGEPLIPKLISECIIRQIFPLHDELKRKKLLRTWALNWRDCTNQPIDEIYSYLGPKIAVYFSFLGMYTRWLTFPAGLGLIMQLVDFGSLQALVLPAYLVSIVFWAVLFFQFWKRKNSALLLRWNISYPVSSSQGYRFDGMEGSPVQSPIENIKKMGMDKQREKEAYQRYELFSYLMRFRNDALAILSVICLHLPFELAYAHLYEDLSSDIIKFALTAVYLCIIQYLTQIGGKISTMLIKYEPNESPENKADSLVYKVFGFYFIQSYIGVFYHVLLHRNIRTLRQVLIQRLMISEVLGNFLWTSLPYLKYSYKKFRVRHKKKREGGTSSGKIQFSSRVEKEYLKPTYAASICPELEDGLFDDFLEITLQFGMVMMFACAFPMAFAFIALIDMMEIRADALKILATVKRPVPRAAATVGAWLNIFQFLIVMSICTNSALLVCLYDREGKWKIEPGLAAILIMEHILLLIKFGLSRFVPEEPAWVKANRVKHAADVQDLCSKQLLRNMPERNLSSTDKSD